MQLHELWFTKDSYTRSDTATAAIGMISCWYDYIGSDIVTVTTGMICYWYDRVGSDTVTVTAEMMERLKSVCMV